MTKQGVREAAAGRWLEILARCGVDSRFLVNRHGPCPGCGGRDRFRFDDLGRNGTFICSQGGGDLLVGDGFRLLEHVLGWDWRRAIAEVAGILGLRVEEGGSEQGRNPLVVPAPVAERSALVLDRAKVEQLVAGTPAIDKAWLWRRSPVDPAGISAAEFLAALYGPGERVLVLVDQRSQGDFLFEKRKAESGKRKWESYRLAARRGVRAERSELPAGGPEGVWFLTQPVSGRWEINPKRAAAGGAAVYTRRSECNVTAWRFFVLESDELEMGLWLRVLVNLPLPVAAIYTSGRRSVHALVRWPVGSKAEWDAARNVIREVVCPLGADRAALTAVRLSRLPGCRRGGELQELLYLDPAAEGGPIRLGLEVRG